MSFSMLELADLLSPVRSHMHASLDLFRCELDSDQAFIERLYAHVDAYHGKQVRPAILLLSAAACGGVDPQHETLAAVVEMVHLATLVHDDILDEADVRRSAPTTNTLWGNERSVLLGDLLFSHAYHLCGSLESQFAARQIGKTAIDLCEGEMMQVVNRNNFDLNEETYYKIITRKTASLIATSSLLGAKYAGADEHTVWRLHAFGESLGIAFQIIDDILDITGDESEVGKSLGLDVQKGKPTLAVIHYLHAQPADRRDAMLHLLRQGSPDAGRQIAGRLRDSDSLDYAFDAAAGRVRRAIAQLADLPPSDARASLTAMAEFTISRSK
jgi:octaprenyl-diphosphate synthase